MIERAAGRLASLSRALLPDRFYVAMRPRFEKILGSREPELDYLVKTLSGKPGRRFIDVGANWGSYSVLLEPCFAKIDAFEPIGRCADALTSYASFYDSNIDVHACALSDHDGCVSLHVPANDAVDHSGSAHVTERIDSRALSVQAKTLDSFGFGDVDLIKIDVEGYERSVLEGASETLRRCRPTLLVEIEQRHIDGPHAARVAFIESFGYHASFLRDGRVVDAAEFVVTRDQDTANLGKRGMYINNFLFEPI